MTTDRFGEWWVVMRLSRLSQWEVYSEDERSHGHCRSRNSSTISVYPDFRV